MEPPPDQTGGDPLAELRDIAPPPEVWDLGQYLLVAGLGLAIVALVLALVAWIRKRARQPRFPKLPGSPRQVAVRALEQLRDGAGEFDCRGIAEAASEEIRTFLHREHGTLARFATAEELLGLVRGDMPPPPPEVEPFAASLRELDQLRYGRGSAPGQEAGPALEAVLQALQMRDKK